MPAEQRVRRDDEEDITPRAVEAGQQRQDEPILTLEARPLGRRPSEHEDLLAEQRVLGDQLRAGPEGIDGGGARQRSRGTGGPQQGLHGLPKSTAGANDDDAHSFDQQVQHAGLLSGLGRSAGSRCGQQTLLPLSGNRYCCGWTSQVARTGVVGSGLTGCW